MVGATQLPLDLGHVTAVSAADVRVAESNAEAHRHIARWPEWRDFAVCLWGPAGCGKSHLAHLLLAKSGGVLLAASMLTAGDVPRLAAHSMVIVEDAERGVDEAALLHLYNHLRETGRFLLLTGRSPPSRWPVGLPDLRSRLTALPVAAILPPDDGLLAALLLKLFADRQVIVGPDVLTFVLARMERSFDAARALVAAIDEAALAGRRPVTVPLVRQVMAAGERSPETP